MLALDQYSSLGAALRAALDRWPNEVCLIEADRDKEKLQLTYADFKELSPPNIEPTEAAATNVLAQFPDASRSLDAYLDPSILGGLTKEGFFTALQQKYK